MKILLADDDKLVRLLVRDIVETTGHEIMEAADGIHGYNLACTWHPDLMILDWMMPGMTGIEVVRKLRQNAKTKEIRVLLVTARGRPVDLEEMESVGITDCIIKPFQLNELLDKVLEVAEHLADKDKIAAAPAQEACLPLRAPSQRIPEGSLHVIDAYLRGQRQ